MAYNGNRLRTKNQDPILLSKTSHEATTPKAIQCKPCTKLQSSFPLNFLFMNYLFVFLSIFDLLTETYLIALRTFKNS